MKVIIFEIIRIRRLHVTGEAKRNKTNNSICEALVSYWLY